MLEKKEITKKLIKNMLINFIIFTAILVVFDFIIYNTINTSLYQDADKELENSVIKTGELEENNGPEREIENEKIPSEGGENKRIVSPRVTIIERDENGNILNENELGIISDYLSDIKFNKYNLDAIYTLQIGADYWYRAINYKITDEEGEAVYLQVMVNVDGESRYIREFVKCTNIWNYNFG